MKQRLLIVTGCLCALLGVALLLAAVADAHATPPPCDNMAASSGVGSCGTPKGYTLCELQMDRQHCTEFSESYAQVMQNFPTACITNNGTNCNMPDANCWRSGHCKWDADTGKCSFDPTQPTGDSFPAPKRTTVTCGQ